MFELEEWGTSKATDDLIDALFSTREKILPKKKSRKKLKEKNKSTEDSVKIKTAGKQKISGPNNKKMKGGSGIEIAGATSNSKSKALKSKKIKKYTSEKDIDQPEISYPGADRGKHTVLKVSGDKNRKRHLSGPDIGSPESTVSKKKKRKKKSKHGEASKELLTHSQSNGQLVATEDKAEQERTENLDVQPSKKSKKNKYKHLAGKSKVVGGDKIVAQQVQQGKSDNLSITDLTLSTQKSQTSILDKPLVPKKKKKSKKKQVISLTTNSESVVEDNTAVPKKNKQEPYLEHENINLEDTDEDVSVPIVTNKRKRKQETPAEHKYTDSDTEDDDGISPKDLNKKGPTDAKPSPKKARKPLTLKEKMEEKLKGARFRFLNEQLYTTTGEAAYNIFSENPDAYQVYHEGFQSQVAKWPMNPVDRMIKFISRKPKTHVVADFGCGEAKIAQTVPNKVHSFDLVPLNKHVTQCDIAEVPLGNETVDIAVFCLALMGTNAVDYLTEANRVLRDGGTLLIAEVQSRFERIGGFVGKLEKLGFTLQNKDLSNKMFVWFEFTKTGEPKGSLPLIVLYPCLYKKR